MKSVVADAFMMWISIILMMLWGLAMLIFLSFEVILKLLRGKKREKKQSDEEKETPLIIYYR
jgi:hypothetical protein